MINVGMGDDNLLHGQMVPLKYGQNPADIRAGIDDRSSQGSLVGENTAVAGEGTDGKYLVNHSQESSEGGRVNSGIAQAKETKQAKPQQFTAGFCALAAQSLLLLRSALRWRRLNSLQYRTACAAACDHYRQRNGRDREDNRTPRGHFGEEIDSSAGAEGGLRPLPAKRTSQIRALARLQ
jgi:hypothetical protein